MELIFRAWGLWQVSVFGFQDGLRKHRTLAVMMCYVGVERDAREPGREGGVAPENPQTSVRT